MPIRNLKPLTYLVIVMVVIDALTVPAILSTLNFAPFFFATVITPVATEVDRISTVFKLATMVVFAWWIFRAGRNLVAFGYEDLNFTPAARIWWFAVPFANLVQPYYGMRELWNASHGKDTYDETVPLVAVWWGMWLANGFMALFFQMMAGAQDMTLFWFQSALDIGLVVVAIQLLRGITRAQGALRGPELSEVFA